MKVFIYPYICCAFGALLGWLVGGMRADAARTARIESVIVGTFGAAIGGIFLVGLWWPAGAANLDFSVGKLALGLVGAGLLLGILGLFRGKVGPLRNSSETKRHRFYE